MAKAKSDAAKSDMERMVTPERLEDDSLESSLRPKRLADFVGQHIAQHGRLRSVVPSQQRFYAIVENHDADAGISIGHRHGQRA